MALIIPLEKKHDIKIFWHHFAAMHGKGVVDGVGAAVKRMASNKVRTEEAEIMRRLMRRLFQNFPIRVK